MNNNERVISPSNKLKSYAVTIGDISLVSDAIISVEISYKNDSPVVKGVILFNDIYDMNSQIDWIGTEVNINYIDLKEEISDKTFKIIDIKEYEHSNYKKAFELTLQDTFSYTLENSFLSKGFTGTTTEALNAYITQLGIEGYTLEFTDSSDSSSFTIPKNMNNLEFFLFNLNKNGYYFYQTRDKVCVKSLSDLSIDNLEIDEDLFTDETDNQYYKNRIIASRIERNNRYNVVPKMRSFAYDITKKKINYYTDNSKTSLLLNDDEANIQDNSGYEDIYQQHLNFNEHTKKIRESFLSQNQIEMAVNGFAKNNVNKIMQLKLRGNISTTEGQIKGNITVSGKYISYKVIDKLIGDTFIQKIYLERADRQLDV